MAAGANSLRICFISDLIEAHNNANDGATFTLAHNEFSHISWDEFKSTVRALLSIIEYTHVGAVRYENVADGQQLDRYSVVPTTIVRLVRGSPRRAWVAASSWAFFKITFVDGF